MNGILPSKRKTVLRRDGHRCLVCRRDHFLTMDHLIARSRGGGNANTNLITLCGYCNQQKGPMSLLKWLHVLAKAWGCEREEAFVRLVRRIHQLPKETQIPAGNLVDLVRSYVIEVNRGGIAIEAWLVRLQDRNTEVANA